MTSKYDIFIESINEKRAKARYSGLRIAAREGLKETDLSKNTIFTYLNAEPTVRKEREFIKNPVMPDIKYDENDPDKAERWSKFRIEKTLARHLTMADVYRKKRIILHHQQC